MCWCRLSPGMTHIHSSVRNTTLLTWDPKLTQTCGKGRALWAACEAQHLLDVSLRTCIWKRRLALWTSIIPTWELGTRLLDWKTNSWAVVSKFIWLLPAWTSEILELLWAWSQRQHLLCLQDSRSSVEGPEWLQSSLSSFMLAMQQMKPQSLKS